MPTAPFVPSSPPSSLLVAPFDAPSKGFLAFLRCETEQQCRNGHLGIVKNYGCAGRSLARFLATQGKRDVPFKKLTRLTMADYEAWLQTRGLCKNTTSCYLRALQAVYNKAVRQGLTEDRHPFLGTYRGVARTVKRAVGHEDIRRLQTLDVRMALVDSGLKPCGRRFDKLEKQLEFARDIFLFCFCCRGMTFVDFAYLRKADISGGVISYVRRKTHLRMTVRVEPVMQQIIDRHPSTTVYQFPLLTVTDDAERLYQQYHRTLGWYNTRLAMLGKMLGGITLTLYVCRHSWATVAYQQHLPLSVISQSMGHDSEKTTEIYLKSLESSVIDAANRYLIEQVLGQGKKKSKKRTAQ